MDFLKSFMEARNQGLTKEEFLPIWENESKLKLLSEEAKVMQLRQPPQETGLGTRNNLYKESKLESLILQQLQKLTQEVKDLGEKQRQHTEQQAEVKCEVDRLSKILTNHIFSAVEELKLRLNQVLDERLVKQTIDGKNNVCSSGTSSEVLGETSLELSRARDASVDSGFHEQQYNLPKELKMMQEGLDSISETNYIVQDDWKLVSQKGKNKQNSTANTGASFTANFKDSESLISQEARFQGQIYDHNKIEVAVENRAESAILYHSKEARRRNKDTTSTDMSINYFPNDGAEFFIPNVRMFRASNQDFFTESFYTRPKACKVCIRLWFNKRGRLGVHLLVTKGILDERHKWPLVFNGSGYIFNQSSGSYTKLWTIQCQKCSMPLKNKEETLGASVCLSTSRDPDTDVTYELLMKKRYVADGDRLLFRWYLESVEDKDDHYDTSEYARTGITPLL